MDALVSFFACHSHAKRAPCYRLMCFIEVRAGTEGWQRRGSSLVWPVGSISKLNVLPTLLSFEMESSSGIGSISVLKDWTSERVTHAFTKLELGCLTWKMLALGEQLVCW